MRKALLLAIFLTIFIMASNAMATPATIALSPNGTNAVRLEVKGVPDGNGVVEEYSWFDRSLGVDLTQSPYTKIEVSFDVYRSGNWLQNFWWFPTNIAVDALATGAPIWGAQWDNYGPPNTPQTVPFLDWVNGKTDTLLDGFYTVKMVWDLESGKANSWYNGVQVDFDVAINGLSDFGGWQFQLVGENANDVLWIDNFSVRAYDEWETIYATDFNNFNVGLLNGQDGWESQMPQNVPEPATLLLLISGLLGVASLRKRMNRTTTTLRTPVSV